ncbi:MAG: hypothetical protein AB4042_11915 [Leptolyngbyaceae cyanobacterium]
MGTGRSPTSTHTLILIAILSLKIMNPENMSEDNLRQREEELRVKEQEIRLRELEMELNKAEQRQQSMQSEPPLYETTKHQDPQRKKSWLRKLPKTLKFGAIVFASLVLVLSAVFIAKHIVAFLLTIGSIVAVGGIGFFGYKLYLDGDDDD